MIKNEGKSLKRNRQTLIMFNVYPSIYVITKGYSFLQKCLQIEKFLHWKRREERIRQHI